MGEDPAIGNITFLVVNPTLWAEFQNPRQSIFSLQALGTCTKINYNKSVLMFLDLPSCHYKQSCCDHFNSQSLAIVSYSLQFFVSIHTKN